MPVPLPVGTRLLHIGPPKTGTTTLQGAFHTNREVLAEHGVHYAGRGQQVRIEAAAAILGEPLPGNPASSLQRWPALVREVGESTAARVVISSETFASASDEQIVDITSAFGDRTHVVITARPLVRLLPSQWQQHVQVGLEASYETWLDAMFHHSDTSTMTPNFWRRHRHDQLAARWAAAVGPRNVTVVALDERDRTMNLRSFEQLLDLPEGTLVPTAQTNRSCSLPEIELIREINRQYHAEGWSRDVYDRLIRFGMASYVKERAPGEGEPAVTTPEWAVASADETAAQIVAGLATSGVNIIGDLASLRPPVTASGSQESPALTQVDLGIAARAVLGVVQHTVTTPREPGSGPRVSEVTSTGLLRIAADRAVARVTRRPRPPVGQTPTDQD